MTFNLKKTKNENKTKRTNNLKNNIDYKYNSGTKGGEKSNRRQSVIVKTDMQHQHIKHRGKKKSIQK